MSYPPETNIDAENRPHQQACSIPMYSDHPFLEAMFVWARVPCDIMPTFHHVPQKRCLPPCQDTTRNLEAHFVLAPSVPGADLG